MPPNNDEFNSDELEPPAWLNGDFFKKVLDSCEENSEDMAVLRYEITPASGKGDHYASIMFRANLEYQLNGKKKNKSLIVKAMPDVEGPKKAHLEQLHIFETEVGMYSEVLPRFERILREIGDDTVLKAPCLYHQLSPHKLLVFEDIVPLGYTVLRGRDVNEEEVKCALSKLAKWHAISYKLSLEEPEFFDKYRHGLINMPNVEQNGFFTHGPDHIVDILKEDPLLKEFVPHFEKLVPDLLARCKASVNEYRDDPQPATYYVLCHSDFHSKNMMFKRNQQSGELEDVMLLDFQFSYMGPIVLDLMYSFFTLLTDDMREDLDGYLCFYFTHFAETLEKIGFEGPMPKLEKLREQMFRYRHFELFLLITLLPLWYGFLVGKYDPTDLVSSAEVRQILYKRRKYIQQMQKILPRYLNMGYFKD